MTKRSASIKETGEELSPAEWERFDAAVADAKAERERPVADAFDPADADKQRDQRSPSD